jgi:5-hydroxyisourate hydrolase
MSASGISTHVLDTSLGKPAAGVIVTLETVEGLELARGVTDADGRIASLLPGGPPTLGDYCLRFATDEYFEGLGLPAFYPEVVIHVRFSVAGGKYHLPLLLSPFGYSTYRGS